MTKTLTIDIAHYALDTDPGSAQRLVDAIEDGFLSGNNICLDFGHIKTLERSFINRSIRVTASLHTQQFLHACLTTLNVSPQVKPALQDIFGLDN